MKLEFPNRIRERTKPRKRVKTKDINLIQVIQHSQGKARQEKKVIPPTTKIQQTKLEVLNKE